MSSHDPRSYRQARLTVRVQYNANGHWEVALPNGRERVTCETFDVARRIAYLSAAHAQPCELIVQDAYHRVVQRQLIDGQPTTQPLDPERDTPTRSSTHATTCVRSARRGLVRPGAGEPEPSSSRRGVTATRIR